MTERSLVADDESEEESCPGCEHDRGLSIHQQVSWRAVVELQGEGGGGTAEVVPEGAADVVMIAKCRQEPGRGRVYLGSIEEIEAAIDDRGDPPS